MSFHGDITNISPTFFQFDKTFQNRYVMEQNMTTDGIYPGRFVLIKYDNDQAISDYVSAYPIEYDGNIIFTAVATDTLGIQAPFKMADFRPVSGVTKTNVTNYYFKRANQYIRVPSDGYYDPVETYYGAYVNDNLTTENYLCSLNQIIQARDPNNGELLNEWYQCTGSGIAHSLNNVGFWTLLAEEDVKTYNRNFWVDMSNYGTDSDFDPLNRGYDSTVWQKIYSEKGERYELVARLNALMPAMELVADAPSQTPLAPHLDTKSSDALYSIHVPTPWGFRVKPATDPEKSDAVATYTPTSLDSHYNRVEAPAITYIGDIYYNLAGFDKVVSTWENDITDNITFIPSGTNKFYYQTEDGDIETYTASTSYPDGEKDTMELSIHLPTLGNAIAGFYDLIYDVNNTNKNKRYLDTKWYNASSPARNIGDPSLGFKTYNLNTVAGTLNTFHNRLGQIIEDIDDAPNNLTEQTIRSFSNDYIYHTKDTTNYYRRANDYEYDELSGTDYIYEPIEVIEAEWQPGVYYIKNGNNYDKDLLDHFVSTPNYYYARKINQNQVQAYEQITLMDYNPKSDTNPTGEDYWYKNGEDFIYEKNSATPTMPENTYYNVTLGTPKELHYGYKPRQFYYKDGNGNYRLATEETPDLSKDYLNINLVAYTNSSWYLPNKYYYFDDPEFKTAPVLDTSPTKVSRSGGLWYLNFGTTPHYSYNIQTGQISQVFLVENMIDVTNTLLDITTVGYLDSSADYQYLYKKDEIGNLIKISDFKYTVVQNKVEADLDKYFIKSDDEYIYQGGTTFDPSATYYTRTFISDELTPTAEKGVPKGEYFLINNITRINDEMYMINKFYTYNEDTKDILLSVDDWENIEEDQDFYTLEDLQITPYEYPFYLPKKYYYKVNSFYFLDDSPKMVDGRLYWILSKLCIIDDEYLECPYGFEWNNELEIVPWRFTLGLRKNIVTLSSIEGFDGNNWSINGVLLRLAKMTEINNPRTRDITTVQGVINKAADMIYTINGTLIPKKMLYVNEYGRISSSSINHKTFVDMMTYVLNKTTSNDEVFSKIEQNEGIVTVSTKKAGGLIISGYTAPENNSNDINIQQIANNDSINNAFVKSQTNINNISNHIRDLDYTDADTTYQVIATINQTDGQIELTRKNAGGLVLTGYEEAAAAADIAATDSINTAFGKTQKNISSLQNAVNILNGDDTTEGSVSKKVKDAIDAVVDGAPTAFDTLKELSDWIADDTTGAAAMVNRIGALEETVDGTLETDGLVNRVEVLEDIISTTDTGLSDRVENIEETLNGTLETDGLVNRVTTVESFITNYNQDQINSDIVSILLEVINQAGLTIDTTAIDSLVITPSGEEPETPPEEEPSEP